MNPDNSPKITIVTPSYNQGSYLDQCIDSILSQNYPNLEYIIMDGGSTDNSIEIIKKYQKHLYYWQSKADNGQYNAINQGFRLSTGDIMGWLNSDDMLHPGALNILKNVFNELPDVKFLTGQRIGFDIEGNKRSYGYEKQTWSRKHILDNRLIHELSLFIMQEATYWRRDLWNKAGGTLNLDYKLAADFELWARLSRYAKLHTVDALIGGFRYYSNEQRCNNFRDEYIAECDSVIDNELKLEWNHDYNDVPDLIKYPLDKTKQVNDFNIIVKDKIDLPKISVITPSYNQGNYLEECIDSVLTQNYNNLEYIIMDGGSTDKSPEIIKKYEKHLHYWQSKKDNGQYFAINEGFKKTSGEIMTWLNSDDKFHPDSFRKVADTFHGDGEIQWLMGRPNGFAENGTQAWVANNLPLWNREKYLLKKYSNPFIQQEGNFWKRELWNKAGGFIDTKLKLAGDLELWARFFRNAELYTVDALLAGFRSHPGQKTALFMDKYHKEALEILDLEINRYKETCEKLYCPPPPVFSFSKNTKEEKKKILVSAIVSVYNSEKYIQGCIEDLLGQTLYKKEFLEIVFVNTGSEQNENEVIERYKNKLPNIKYEKVDKRETVYQAWNRGIKAASGKYVTNANTDDRHRYDALELLANVLEKDNKIALAYANQVVTNIENETFEQHTASGYFLWPEYNRIQLIHTSCCGPQPVWRRALHDEFGYFDESLKVAGDYDWWLRISEKYNFRHIPEFLGLYLLSAQSVEHEQGKACIEETNKVRAYFAGRAKINQLDYNKYKPTFLYDTVSKDTPKVSVIIPTYNRADYLPKAVASVLKQTFTNIEIIVVNDAGKDVTGILKTLNDSRIKLITHDQNKGLAAARNTGIKHASGKYIALLDDDDLFYPDHIQTALSNLTRDIKVVYTDAVRTTYFKKGNKYTLVNKNTPYSIEYHKDKLLFGNIAPVNCFVFEKELALSVNFFDEQLKVLEDWDFWLKLSRVTGFKHVKKNTVQVNWRTDGTSMTSSRQEDFVNCRKIITDKYTSEVLSTNPEAIIKEFNDVWEKDNKIISPLVSIIVLTYNGLQYNKEFIESVLQFTTNFELIVIDNASTDGTVEYLKGIQSMQANIKVVLNEVNVGFPCAVNQGIKLSDGNFVLIANNDIVVTEGWLDRLVEVAESEIMTGIVGPVSNSVSGVQLDKDAKYKSITQMHNYSKKLRRVNKDQTLEFPRVAFLCTLIKKEVIEKIGGLDERFSPGNFEDDDFCLRAQLEGFKTVIAKDVFIHHYGSKSFTAQGIDKYKERLEVNRRIFIDKWGADPEEIWLKGKSINKRKTMIPLNKNIAVESFNRTILLLEDKDFIRARYYIAKAIDEYSSSLEQLVSLEQLISLSNNIKKAAPKISILVLTYNRAEMLKDCLTSLKSNLYYKDDFELIIADNGSTDHTTEVITQFSPDKVIRSESNKGWNSYKELFASAKGEYIIELDDDVLDFPMHFDKTFLEYFNEFPGYGILCLDVIQNEHTNGAKPTDDHYTSHTRNDKTILEGPTGGWCLCLKKSVFDEVGGISDYDLNNLFFEDGLLYNKVKDAGYKTGMIKDVKCFHACGLHYSSEYGYIERDIEKYRISGFHDGFVFYSDKKFESCEDLKLLWQYAVDLYKIKYYQKSLERFTQVYQIASRVDMRKENPGLTATLLCFIGLNYHGLKQMDTAVEHIKDALNCSAESCINISKTLTSAGISEAKIVLDIAEETGCVSESLDEINT